MAENYMHDELDVASSRGSMPMPSPEALPGGDFARDVAFESVRKHLFGRHAPRTFGRYRVESRIGHGGMGVVYRAHDPELDRFVALKLIGEAWSLGEAEHMRSALLRDARSAAGLQHPNIIEIHDSGIDEGDVFVVMELIEGADLGQWSSLRKRTWRDVVEVFIDAGRGLAAAHAQGMVHRDFKPSNVMVGTRGRVVVADFGLARDYTPTASPSFSSLSARERQEISMAETHGLAGTVAYMSPEQLQTGAFSPRSDQFSYCVALYRTLFGELPFAQRDVEERLSRIIAGDLRPPRMTPRVPRRLLHLVRTGLSGAPARRHASMDHLVEQLEQLLRRRRRVVWASSCAALAVGTVMGSMLDPAVSPPPPCQFDDRLWTVRLEGGARAAIEEVEPGQRVTTQQAISELRGYALAWEEERQNACEATRVRHEQSDAMLGLQMECLARREFVFSSIAERVEADSRFDGSRILALMDSLEPVTECRPANVAERASWAQAKWRELEARIWDTRNQGLVKERESAYQQAVVIESEAATAEFPYLQADAALLQAHNGGGLTGDPQRQEAVLAAASRAFDLAVKVGGWRLAVDALLARVELELEWDGPREHHEEYLRLARALASRSPRVEELLVRIGTMHGRLLLDLGHVDESVTRYRQTLEHAERSLGLEDRSIHALVNELGMALYEQGNWVDAERSWRWLANSCRRGQVATPLFPTVLHNLGMLYQDRALGERADSLFLEAATLLSSLTQWSGSERAELRVELGIHLRSRGRYEEAEAVLRDAVGVLRDVGALRPMLFALALDQLAETLLARERHDEAARVASELLLFVTQHYPLGHIEIAKAQLTSGKVALERGAFDEAQALLSPAHAARIGTEGTRTNAELGLRIEVTFYYAQAVYSADGATSRVRDLLREALQMLEGSPFQGFAETIRRWAGERGLKP